MYDVDREHTFGAQKRLGSGRATQLGTEENGLDEKENDDNNSGGMFGRSRSQLQVKRDSRKENNGKIEEDKNEDFESPSRKNKGYEFWLEA